ncbi:MAG: family 78 glycoside hydrolase catalytic domain [Burkholderiales bacterium]|nr:family 78 glycoside hydrolase catalytic domain [Opitutaceae bacterium]
MSSKKRSVATALRVLDLRCDQLREPMGLENPKPQLNWRIDAGGRRGARQTAYRIQASTTRGGAADLWDSGRVASDETLGVVYAGRAPESRLRVWWTVEAWDEAGARAVSEPAYWEMGLSRAEDWTARWIGMELAGGAERGTPAPFLRKGFALRARPTAARLYVSALGLYEFCLNGKRVGSEELAPGWTDYTKRVPYQVHNVTAALRAGENRMGSILGDGWYCGHVAWKGREIYGERPWLLAQLEVTYADGTTERFASDGTWEGRFGPIVSNDLLQGEVYDARRELTGWCEAGGADEGWRAVAVRAEAGPALCFRIGPPVVAHEAITPVAEPRYIRQWDRIATIYDFGQNLVGRVRLRVRGKAGSVVKLRHAEMLQPNGDLYLENLRTAAATDFYTLRGAPEGETWEPRFTFHGFRYVELSGLAEVDATTCTAVVLHSDTPKTGDFACSEELLNQLWRNIDWGQRGNFLEVPTDCPQRDERLGWTGDAQVFVRTAAWNRDVAAFFHKWARDLADTQGVDGRIGSVAPNPLCVTPDDGGPAWADAVVLCPWAIHERYGDVAILEKEYATMVRFLGYLENGPKTRYLINVHPDQVEWGGFGDWLALDGSGKTDGGTPKDLIGTAFFAYDAALMAKIATRLGKARDAARFAKLAERVKRAFQRRYVTPDGLVAAQTQTSYVLALHFDLLPEESREKAAAELVRDITRRGYLLTTGFVGTSYLPFVLTETGHLDVAYRLLFQTKWPSWLYAVTQGATTIWERWDGWTAEKGFQSKGMNSFNHYAYGAIGDWMTRVVGGVAPDPEGPGYKRIVLRPQIGGAAAEKLTRAEAWLETRHGRVASAWRREKGGALIWEVEVPANTTATAWVPAAEGARVTESGGPLEKAEGLRVLRREADAVVVELAGGRYRFNVK